MCGLGEKNIFLTTNRAEVQKKLVSEWLKGRGVEKSYNN